MTTAPTPTAAVLALLTGTPYHLVQATRQRVSAWGEPRTDHAAALVLPGKGWTPEDWHETADEAAAEWSERAYEIADEYATA